MPAVKGHNATLGVPMTQGVHGAMQFSEVIPIFEQLNFSIIGVTKDSAGSPLASCRVCVYRADNLQSVQITSEQRGVDPVPASNCVWTGTSDGSGNFSAGPFSGNSGRYFAVAFDPGGTLAGLTLNNVEPVYA